MVGHSDRRPLSHPHPQPPHPPHAHPPPTPTPLPTTPSPQALHQADDEASSLNLPHRAQPEEPTSSAGVGPDGRPVPEWDYLNNFFKKYNKVLLDVASIRREKQRLQAEVRGGVEVDVMVTGHAKRCQVTSG